MHEDKSPGNATDNEVPQGGDYITNNSRAKKSNNTERVNVTFYAKYC